MNILILNGSPKGNYSVTLQSCLYLEQLYKEHSFSYLNVGQQIRSFEKDFENAKVAFEKANLIIFSYPVYTFIAPSQLHKFIELMKKSGINFENKFATQITTSKHFYDITAHKYIEENCFDMNMKVIKGLSQDMEDLTTTKGQNELKTFFEYVIHCVNNNIFEVNSNILNNKIEKYVPTFDKTEKSNKYKVAIVADLATDDENLFKMIEDFQNVFPYETQLINLQDFKFQGGCLGCFNCATNGKCIYKDNFDTFLREEIQTKDAIVIAFSIKDHSMGPLFKMYDDRQFCNGHRTVTEGMPFGYIINGNYESESNLKTIVEARAEVGHNFLSGVGYNNKSIEQMSKRLDFALNNKYLQPRNFYGIGGMKIFRDLIWLMRGIMKADHKFYKKHGIYDFPQKQRGKMIAMCMLGSLIRNKKIKAKMGPNMMNEGMLMPYKKVIKNLDKQEK